MSAPAHIARQNGMKGGRPKGSLSKTTLEKQKVMEEFKMKVLRAADVLFQAQLHLAIGQTFLYKIEKELQIGPKGGRKSQLGQPPQTPTAPPSMTTSMAVLADS